MHACYPIPIDQPVRDTSVRSDVVLGLFRALLGGVDRVQLRDAFDVAGVFAAGFAVIASGASSRSSPFLSPLTSISSDAH